MRTLNISTLCFWNISYQDHQGQLTREDKTTTLVRLLEQRGETCWQKFISALHLSGHVVLANFLKSQEYKLLYGKTKFSFEELFQKIPNLERVLTLQEKQKLRGWVKDKTSEASLHVHMASPSSRAEVNAQSKGYRSSVDMLHTIQEKDQEINAMKTELKRLKEHLGTKEDEISMLKHQVMGQRTQHREELRNVIKANTASENSNETLKHRLMTFDSTIKAMNIRISKYFGTDEHSAKHDADNVRVSVLDENVRRLVERILELEDTLAWRDEQWKDDRKALLMDMQILDRGQNLLDAFHEYVIQARAALDNIFSEIDMIGQLVNTVIEDMPSPRVETKSPKTPMRLPSEGEFKFVLGQLVDIKDKVSQIINDSEGQGTLQSKDANMKPNRTFVHRNTDSFAGNGVMNGQLLTRGGYHSMTASTSHGLLENYIEAGAQNNYENTKKHSTCPLPSPSFGQRLLDRTVRRGSMKNTDSYNVASPTDTKKMASKKLPLDKNGTSSSKNKLQVRQMQFSGGSPPAKNFGKKM